jgi:hypothetical protein
MNIAAVVSKLQAAGVGFRLDNARVKVWFPDPRRRNELAVEIAFLRDHRSEVANLLKSRSAIPTMPRGVRLVEWDLKEPPVCLESYSVVTDSAKFVKSTLRQLKVLLENPKARVGWTMAQLIDRLAQVGVTVELEPQPKWNTSRKNPVKSE